MDSAGKVIVLTGPPGAGKTTVARLLVASFPHCVHVHSDDFWGFIRQGAIPPYLPEAHAQNQTVMRALVHAAFAFAGGGYSVVLDGVVGPWFLEPFLEGSARTEVPLHYVVLRPDESTTVARAGDRGDGALTEPGPVRSMHRQFADIREYERHVVDSTNLTANDTAEAVLRALAAGELLLPAEGPPPRPDR